jgi:hypothetical protein
MKTPMQELVDFIREDGTRDLDGNLEVNLGAYDLNGYIEKERQMIEKAFTQGKKDGVLTINYTHKTTTSKQYYDKIIKQ